MQMLLARVRKWEVPLVLLGIVVLSYGLWIPWMGLFGNDLPYLWYYHRLGPWGPGDFASIDRPFSAVFYAGSMFALGEAVWPYHVFLLVLRWLSAVLFWQVLRMVWPGGSLGAAAAALLMAVYPGFRQNPVALEFILHFAVLNLFLLSLWAALKLADRPKRAALLALVSAVGAGGLFWLEYFIGLEILRPIFLWIVTRRQGLRGRAQWKRIFFAWAPAAFAVGVFLFWRVVIFSFPTYKPVLLEELRASPLTAVLQLAQIASADVWTVFARAWMQTFALPEGRRAKILFLALAFAAAALVLLPRLLPRKNGADRGGSLGWGEQAFLVGVLAMLAGGSIFWLTRIPITLEFPWDRSTLSLMPGACLAAAGLLEMLIAPRYRSALLALLVALPVGMHFVNAQEYCAEWNKLRDFYWQLTWRAPALAPGTLFLFDTVPLNRYSDNDMTAMLNWTYAPDLHGREIPYKVFDLTLRLGTEHAGLPGIEKDLPVENSHRGVTFHSTTSETVAFIYNPPGCLKLLDHEDALLPGLPDRIKQVLPMTRLDQVLDSDAPARPPEQLGPEPAHGWCFYFQKAELAIQLGDYQGAAALGEKAFAAGLRPSDPAELLPFIEGYARSGASSRAQDLSLQAAQQAGLLRELCAIWREIDDPAAAVMLGELSCQP